MIICLSILGYIPIYDLIYIMIESYICLTNQALNIEILIYHKKEIFAFCLVSLRSSAFLFFHDSVILDLIGGNNGFLI